jgi:hypothetical protein
MRCIRRPAPWLVKRCLHLHLRLLHCLLHRLHMQQAAQSLIVCVVKNCHSLLPQGIHQAKE